MTIEPGAPDSLHLTPRAVVSCPGETLRVAAAVWDRQGNPLPAAPVWTADEALAIVDTTGLVTATGEGEGWIHAAQGEARDSIHIQVVAAPIIATLLEPLDAVITADSTLTFTAEGLTSSGDTIALSPGWFTGGNVGRIDEAGLFQPVATGAGWVGAEVEGERESTTVTVLSGEPVLLRVQPETAEVVAGETLSVEALLFDRLGNPVDAEVAWETDSLCGAVVNGRISCTRAGAWTAVARSGELADTLVLSVVAAPPVLIEITPAAATLSPGETITFHAALADPYGNVGNSPITWSVIGGIGEIDPAGSFTASLPGTGSVTAQSGVLVDTSTVVVDSTTEAPPLAPLLSIRSESPAYDPACWPGPICLVATLADSSGEEITGLWPDSATVQIALLDSTLVVSPDASGRRRWIPTFPDTLEIDAAGFGGCGRLWVMMVLEENGTAASDTLFLATPDVTGDLRIDRLDIGHMLQAEESGDADGCLDFDGDGSISVEDLEQYVVPAHCGRLSTDGADSFPEEEGCTWLSLGESREPCGMESTAARFHLYSGTADSIRAMEVYFPRPDDGSGEITWHPTDLWHDVRVVPLPSKGDRVGVLLIDRGGVVLPAGAPLLEVRCCGASEESFAKKESEYALLGPDFVPDRWGKASIQLLLDTEDTTAARPDSGAGGSPPPSFALLPGRPNPFRTSLTVQFLVPAPGAEVRIEVYNIHGERVALVENGSFPPGSHMVQWNATGPRGRTLSPGAYFLRFHAPETVITRKIILVP